MAPTEDGGQLVRGTIGDGGRDAVDQVADLPPHNAGSQAGALTSAERQRRLRALRGPPVTFHVEPGMRAALERLAQAQGRSVGDLVRSALSLYLRD